MKKSVLVSIIVGVSLILIGGIIFTAAMFMFKWDFKGLSTESYETNKYNITEEYKDVSIKTKAADIEFIPSDSDKASVECYERTKEKHTVSVRDGVLTIEVKDTRKWYNHIGINFKSPKITVALPEGEYAALSVKANTSNVKIPKDFKFESAEIKGTTGNLNFEAAVSGDLKARFTTGDISVKNITAQSLDLSATTGQVSVSDVTCQGNVRVKVTTGKADLKNLVCEGLISDGGTGDIALENVTAAKNISVERSTGDVKLIGTVATEKLTIETDTGDVKFDSSDAGNIEIETDTGGVKGTLLTDKIFFVETDTGSVNVPKTDKGGRCEISTDTGDVKISIK